MPKSSPISNYDVISISKKKLIIVTTIKQKYYICSIVKVKNNTLFSGCGELEKFTATSDLYGNLNIT